MSPLEPAEAATSSNLCLELSLSVPKFPLDGPFWVFPFTPLCPLFFLAKHDLGFLLPPTQSLHPLLSLALALRTAKVWEKKKIRVLSVPGRACVVLWIVALAG